jgi:hypothetical protein
VADDEGARRAKARAMVAVAPSVAMIASAGRAFRQVAGLLAGLDALPPGRVPFRVVPFYGAVARKP